jgi:hypothetical protein
MILYVSYQYLGKGVHTYILKSNAKKKKPNTARVTSLVLALGMLIASIFGTTSPHRAQWGTLVIA